MEAFYLLCSIFSTTFISFTLSILLPFHLFLRRFFNPRAAADGCGISLYQGTVWHERRRPVHHSFRYSVRYALVDLDRSHRSPPDHLTADEARRVAQTHGPVFLLTIPPSVGYEQNPLSVYYCYDVEGPVRTLKRCIAEVTNTPWAERVSFLFNPNSDVVAKPLHVSPFMDMSGNWSMKTNDPEDNLYIAISVQHPKLGNYFTATLTAARVSSVAGDHEPFFWLMPHKVALWIYWHAFKLWWKNVAFIQHPRYDIPTYREEALLRDRNLQCCESFGENKLNHLQAEKKKLDCGSDTRTSRCFTWRDAKWPWC